MVEDSNHRTLTGNTNKWKIKSSERAYGIIELLRETEGATLTEISRTVDLTPGSGHTYLSTMENMGYVVRSDNEYELGPEFIMLGEYAKNNSRLYQAAKSELDKLAAKTEEAVHLIIEHYGQGIALYERYGEEAVGTGYHPKLQQWPHQHLHCTASGKAILSHLSETRVSEIIENRGLAHQTPATITKRSAFFEELATIG